MDEFVFGEDSAILDAAIRLDMQASRSWPPSVLMRQSSAPRVALDPAW